jgi:hypothetical protein
MNGPLPRDHVVIVPGRGPARPLLPFVVLVVSALRLLGGAEQPGATLGDRR